MVLTTFAAPSLKLWSVSDKASVVKGYDGMMMRWYKGMMVQRYDDIKDY